MKKTLAFLLSAFFLASQAGLASASEKCDVSAKVISNRWVSFNDKPHHTFRFLTDFTSTDCIDKGCSGHFSLEVTYHHPDDMSSGSEHVLGSFNVKPGESVGEAAVDHHLGFRDPVIVDKVTVQRAFCTRGS